MGTPYFCISSSSPSPPLIRVSLLGHHGHELVTHWYWGWEFFQTSAQSLRQISYQRHSCISRCQFVLQILLPLLNIFNVFSCVCGLMLGKINYGGNRLYISDFSGVKSGWGSVTVCLRMVLCKLGLGLLLFVFLATPVACGSSWARDQTHATAVTTATLVTTPDP